MKLLVQSDDFGITRAVTDGILHGIKHGIIRNTGLFVNMESSEYAAKFIKDYPVVCFGIDVNLVTGRPVSDPLLIPDLVDEQGKFIKSTARFASNKKVDNEGFVTIFEVDPYPYDQVLVEVENQVKKYLELTGKKPEYLHGHSLITPNIVKALRAMGEKYNIVLTFDHLQALKVNYVPSEWNIKPVFSMEKQMVTDVEENVLNVLPSIKEHDVSVLICHAGYIDDELFDYSTYTIIRNKDLKMTTSDRIKEWLDVNQVELITHRDLRKE